MRVKDREELRTALRVRVSRRIAGRGIPAHMVEDAVERVLAALDARTGLERPRPEGDSVVVLASTTRDLASRVRSVLGEHATATALGSATAGRHTVVTARVSREGRTLLERAAATIPASISIVPSDAGRPA